MPLVIRRLLAGAGAVLVLLLVHTASTAERLERTLSVVPVSGDTLRIVATVRLGGPGSLYEEATESIRVLDGRGITQFSESFRSASDERDTLRHMIDVSAQVIEWSGGRGVRVDYYEEPSAPGWDGTCRYFVLRDRALVPVTSWCEACGEIGPDDVVVEHRWMYWFAVVLYHRIHFGRPAGGMEIIRVAEDGYGDLQPLQIARPDLLRRYYEDSTATFDIRLFGSPVGSGVQFDSVTVSARSDVEFQRACVHIDADGSVQLRRVEVLIDGRRGFVEESDLPALGLRQAG